MLKERVRKRIQKNAESMEKNNDSQMKPVVKQSCSINMQTHNLNVAVILDKTKTQRWPEDIFRCNVVIQQLQRRRFFMQFAWESLHRGDGFYIGGIDKMSSRYVHRVHQHGLRRCEVTDPHIGQINESYKTEQTEAFYTKNGLKHL